MSALSSAPHALGPPPATARDRAHRSYADGEFIVREDDEADSLFLVTDGEVQCTRAGESLMHLQQGQFFGESALGEEGSRRLASVVAVGPVRCAKLMGDDVKKYLGDLNETMTRNFNMKVPIAPRRLLCSHGPRCIPQHALTQCLPRAEPSTRHAHRGRCPPRR